ncbi:MAG: two-component sensor histidine kinase, partial [Proteobacteria bacterium]|nr:two-component sensor histidine kinase [Pseudomonadota bacterium]
ELYEPLSEEKHQKLGVRTTTLPIVHADRDMLFQALANLLDNAVKYTPIGGIIDIHLLTRDGKAVFSICDSGPGIAPAERDKVFQRFYRSDASRSSTGNGLGLSLVQAITHLHGAQITLRGNDPGLCIDLAFPAADSR